MSNLNCEQESIAEVTVIDSQFQHFSSYIDVIRVFKCRLCSFCSPLEHVIASHMSEVHFPRRNYLCKQCLFVFEDRDQLTNHLESAHGTKSINVCFGDTPTNYTSPPPSWRGSRSEDNGMSRLSVGDERCMDEGRNGRVTSSTGNLANLRDDVQDSPIQTERMEHNGSFTNAPAVPSEQQWQQSAVGEDPNGKHLVSGSCHPSSSSQDDCEIVDQRPAREPVPGETTHVQHQTNQDYIKAEPISPVRQYFPPKISIDAPDEQRVDDTLPRQAVAGDNIDSQALVSPTTGNNNSHDPVVSRTPRMLNRSTTIALSPTEKGDNVENELALARPVQPSFTSYIIRQSSFEVGEDSGYSAAGTPPEPADRVRLQQQDSTSVNLAADPRMGSQNSPVYNPRHGSERRSMAMHRQDSIEEGRYGQTDPREPEESPAATSRPTAEVPPVTQTETRNRSHRLTFREMAINQMLRTTEKCNTDSSAPLSLDLNSGPGAFSGMTGIQKAGRPRSFSISEGDTRALYSGLHSEYPAMSAVRVPGATTDRDRLHYGSNVQSGWHPYPGLVYQSLSVDAGAAKYWRLQNQGQMPLAPQEESPTPQETIEMEEGRNTEQNPSMEGSVLYQALQSNESNSSNDTKRRRNSFNVGSIAGVDGVIPNPSWPHPWTQRRGRSEVTQRTPWAHGSSPFPVLGQREKDNSIEGSSPLGLRNGTDQQGVFHHKRFRSMERSASEGHNSTANPHRRGSGQGISSESSQDLAQADDITRQVQQVMEGTNTLYSARDKSVPIWTEVQQGPAGVPIDPSDKDADLRRRTRKSTFNIYREIPERKRKLDRGEEEKIKNSYNPDGSFDYFTLTGWKAYKCDLCKKRRFKTASELEEHKRRKHGRRESSDANSDIIAAGSPCAPPISVTPSSPASISPSVINTSATNGTSTTTTATTIMTTENAATAPSTDDSSNSNTAVETKASGGGSR